MSFIVVLITNIESMCEVRPYKVKAVFHLGILFGIFTEGLKELNITFTLVLLHLGTGSS